MKPAVTCAAVAGALLCLLPAAAGAAGEASSAAAAAAAALSEGTVQKIDKAGGTVTLAHGPIVNIGMPGMTMAFKAKDAKLLARFKEGDKVRFRVEELDGTLILVRIEAAK